MKRYGVNPDPETLQIITLAARQMEVIFSLLLWGPVFLRKHTKIKYSYKIFFSQITVVMKIFWGDARDKLCEAIDKTPLSCVVIGNRGLGKLKRSDLFSRIPFVIEYPVECWVKVEISHFTAILLFFCNYCGELELWFQLFRDKDANMFLLPDSICIYIAWVNSEPVCGYYLSGISAKFS